MENRIRVIVHKAESLVALNESFTSSLAKVLSKKLPYNSIDNFIREIETIYADEISAANSNIMKGEKNEYGCDLHKEV